MRLLAGLLVLLCAGCAMLAPGADERAKLGEIVSQAVAAAKASKTAQEHALRAAQEEHKRDANMASTLRLATLLAALPAPLGDDSAAYALVRPLAKARGNSAYENFGALLAGQIAARLKLARERERLAQSSRQHEDELRRDFESQQRAAEEREAKLQEQLDALKSIERGIVEREEKIRRDRR